MAKARKSAKRKVKKAKRGGKTRAKTRKTKARRSKATAGVIGALEEAAVLRRRLAGRNTFED